MKINGGRKERELAGREGGMEGEREGEGGKGKGEGKWEERKKGRRQRPMYTGMLRYSVMESVL